MRDSQSGRGEPTFNSKVFLIFLATFCGLSFSGLTTTAYAVEKDKQTKDKSQRHKGHFASKQRSVKNLSAAKKVRAHEKENQRDKEKEELEPTGKIKTRLHQVHIPCRNSVYFKYPFIFLKCLVILTQEQY